VSAAVKTQRTAYGTVIGEWESIIAAWRMFDDDLVGMAYAGKHNARLDEPTYRLLDEYLTESRLLRTIAAREYLESQGWFAGDLEEEMDRRAFATD
jgi:hypothetical protein